MSSGHHVLTASQDSYWVYCLVTQSHWGDSLASRKRNRTIISEIQNMVGLLFHPQFGHWGPGRWDQNDCSLMGSTGAKTSEGSVENEKKLLTEKTLDISITFSMVNVLVLDWLLFINNVLIRKIISALVLKYVICLMGKDDCPLLICSLLLT